MATTFKTFANNDVSTTRTLLHESIPLTGTIVSGTYGGQTVATGSEPNIKNFSHGLFQSIYDYPHLSSSSNHIFDITFGYHSSSQLHIGYTAAGVSGGDDIGNRRMPEVANTMNTQKRNIYNQMAQLLMGHDIKGNIKPFQLPNGQEILEAYFINFSRLLVKDEIKKGSFAMIIGSGTAYDTDRFKALRKYHDEGAATTYYTDSPAGEYAVITSSVLAGINPPDEAESDTTAAGCAGKGCITGSGLIFYQAGIMVLSCSDSMMWHVTGGVGDPATFPGLQTNHARYGCTVGGDIDGARGGAVGSWASILTGSSISGTAHALRHRIQNISFNNTTELNSSIYFCRANHNEFNYSSNPTYATASKLRVKNTSMDQPVSYITTVGLYSADNELLAVAKLSEPLKKTPDTELTLRVRLDY